MEVKLYQIEVNHHLMSHRWRCCSLLSTAPPPPPPMVVTKGISIAVMRCEVQLVHYTLIFVTCYNSYVAAAVLYTVIISGLYFAIIESCHNRCFISDVSSQYVTVTECDTSRTISYLALSIVRMFIVHTNMFHHRTFHLPFIRASCSASCPRIRLLVPWGEDERAETLTSAAPDTELGSTFPLSSSPSPAHQRLFVRLK